MINIFELSLILYSSRLLLPLVLESAVSLLLTLPLGLSPFCLILLKFCLALSLILSTFPFSSATGHLSVFCSSPTLTWKKKMTWVASPKALFSLVVCSLLTHYPPKTPSLQKTNPATFLSVFRFKKIRKDQIFLKFSFPNFYLIILFLLQQMGKIH